VLCERWTPLVVRELLCGSKRFNDLHRGVPRMSTRPFSRARSVLMVRSAMRKTYGGGWGRARSPRHAAPRDGCPRAANL
jgi:hypothetical protein